MACHGPAGTGNPGPAFPHIGGQQSAYVVRRLQEYRTGTTTEQDHHLFDMMATVAKNLSDDEIQSLGSYLQGLHERSAADAGNAPVVAAAAAPAPAPAPAPATNATTASPASVATPAEAGATPSKAG